jgi:hypothetical protein
VSLANNRPLKVTALEVEKSKDQVAIVNPQNRLKSGMIASLTISGQQLERPLTAIPLTAVIRNRQETPLFAKSIERHALRDKILLVDARTQ